MVITSALHAEGPRFEPGRNHTVYNSELSPLEVVYWEAVLELSQKLMDNFGIRFGFRSVVVITCASHAQGPRFEPGRNHGIFAKIFSIKNN